MLRCRSFRSGRLLDGKLTTGNGKRDVLPNLLHCCIGDEDDQNPVMVFTRTPTHK